MNDNCEEILEKASIRATAVRILILRTILSEVHGVFSLYDMEDKLPSVDRSTLFRTLMLFAEKKILHNVDDGSGREKYCVCHCSEEHHHTHVHFRCTRCGRTICLEDVEVPSVPVPKGFYAGEAEYIIKGLCDKCAKCNPVAK